MITLHEVRAFFHSNADSVSVKEGLYEEFVNLYGKIGDTIIKELRISRRDAANLPPETQLGDEAEKAFTKLKYWLSTKHKSLER